MTVPVYIAEAAPASVRGKLVTLNTVFITGGQFFASVIDGIFSYDTKNGWRYLIFQLQHSEILPSRYTSDHFRFGSFVQTGSR